MPAVVFAPEVVFAYPRIQGLLGMIPWCYTSEQVWSDLAHQETFNRFTCMVAYVHTMGGLLCEMANSTGICPPLPPFPHPAVSTVGSETPRQVADATRQLEALANSHAVNAYALGRRRVPLLVPHPNLTFQATDTDAMWHTLAHMHNLGDLAGQWEAYQVLDSNGSLVPQPPLSSFRKPTPPHGEGGGQTLQGTGVNRPPPHDMGGLGGTQPVTVTRGTRDSGPPHQDRGHPGLGFDARGTGAPPPMPCERERERSPGPGHGNHHNGGGHHHHSGGHRYNGGGHHNPGGHRYHSGGDRHSDRR